MPMKEILYKFQPFQLYLVLTLTCLYFLIQLILSQTTHSITLLVACYQSLCNVIALTGNLLTRKNSDEDPSRVDKCPSTSSIGENNVIEINPDKQQKELIEKHLKSKQQRRQNQLMNTFGWTRIDVLTMLIVCIFLASLCFSVLVESLQTLVHIDHQDTMHLPIPVLIVGTLGVLLNGLSFLLIGGYSFRQSSFIHLTSKGDVILNRVISRDGNQSKSGSNETIQSNNTKSSQDLSDKKKRQNIHDICRDLCSSIFVIICASIIFVTGENDTSKLIDPIISIISCITLLFLSYPYMKQAGLILLQTIPDTIDIEIFKKNLLDTFKDIESIHDLHIWQLTSHRYVSTAHIIFQNPQVYSRIIGDILNYFQEQGINQVTIQPEFSSSIPKQDSPRTERANIESTCQLKCKNAVCQPKNCCIDEPETTKDLKQNKSESHLQSVVAVKNLDESDTSEIILDSNRLTNSTSFKSLYSDNEPIRINTKKSTVSLNLPSSVGMKKYQKAVSAIESSYHPNVGKTSSCCDNDTLIVKTHYVSDSVINSEHSSDNQKKIVIENKMVAQLDQNEMDVNNEMENLYNRCKDSDDN